MNKRPELLAPAGSMAALRAAIEGGADAVYFGASAFNARMFAENFATRDSLREAVSLCHAYGVKAYLTLNTAVYDRELDAFLDTAREALAAGVDAFIVSDIGAASLLHRTFPDAVLHASTQFSAHSLGAVPLLREQGFSRVVLARETPLRDIRTFVRESDLACEVFIHGALCVSHSGQCLFSSLVGGRSGNRGACAQPCRLPYRVGGREQAVLSLKDLCLAAHVEELIDAGVASLKIEGRMKSPEYVYAVTAAWRRLLDRGRNATEAELTDLSRIFSRSGFTDAYFTEGDKTKMRGVRSEEDKAASRALPPFEGLRRRLSADLVAHFRIGEPSYLAIRLDDGRFAEARGAIPEAAQNPSAAMSREDIAENLLRFGNTPLSPRAVDLTADEGILIRRSAINALRREAVEALFAEEHPLTERPARRASAAPLAHLPARTAYFAHYKSIPPEATSYFDRIYLPLYRLPDAVSLEGYGVALPPVIFDHEREEVERALRTAAARGVRHALLTNPGQLPLLRACGMQPMGDLRLNITNRESAEVYRSAGVEDLILSPELKSAALREIPGGRVTVYGRLPLMLLEKCVIREIADCRRCDAGFVLLTDRTGARFPVLREPGSHRNVVYNSVPTYMADRPAELRGLRYLHFIFTDESAERVAEIIRAYRDGIPAPPAKLRRL